MNIVIPSIEAGESEREREETTIISIEMAHGLNAIFGKHTSCLEAIPLLRFAASDVLMLICCTVASIAVAAAFTVVVIVIVVVDNDTIFRPYTRALHNAGNPDNGNNNFVENI